MKKIYGTAIQILSNIVLLLLLLLIAFKNQDVFIEGYYSVPLSIFYAPIIFLPAPLNAWIGVLFFLLLALILFLPLFNGMGTSIMRNEVPTTVNSIIIFGILLLLATTGIVVSMREYENSYVEIPRAFVACFFFLLNMFFPYGYQFYLRKINGGNKPELISLLESFSIWSNLASFYGCVHIIFLVLGNDDLESLDTFAKFIGLGMVASLQVWQIICTYRDKFNNIQTIKWIR